jgi:solute:Na+ symporter, SSS family
MHLAISPIDVTILIAYLVGVLLLGLWFGRKQHDVSEYLLGGRSIPWWGVLLSIVATETSTVTFLSVPGMTYDSRGGSLVFLQLAIGYVVGRLVVVLLFLPHYFRGSLFTAYQVLHQRFGGATGQTASFMFLITRNLADGLRLYLTALVLKQVSGLDLSLCILVMGVTTIVYTFAGGMKSVVWTDCIQFGVYILGAVLAGWIIVSNLPGGGRQYIDFGAANQKFRLFDFSFDLKVKYTFWSGLIGGAFLTLGTHGTDQLMVQRYLAGRGLREAGRALALSGLVVFAQFALFLLIGVGLACYYSGSGVQPVRNDEVFARFIVDHLPVGVVGVTLAAVFAAAMSTLSSSLNSSATVLVNDFYLPRFRVAPSERHLVRASRALTVVFGFVQIGVGIAGQGLQESVINNVLAIASFTTGLTLGLFFLGVFTRRVPQWAALIGLVGGAAVLTAVWYATSLAWPWYSVVGSLTTLGIGLLAGVIGRAAPPRSEAASMPPHSI